MGQLEFKNGQESVVLADVFANFDAKFALHLRRERIGEQVLHEEPSTMIVDALASTSMIEMLRRLFPEINFDSSEPMQIDVFMQIVETLCKFIQRFISTDPVASQASGNPTAQVLALKTLLKTDALEFEHYLALTSAFRSYFDLLVQQTQPAAEQQRKRDDNTMAVYRAWRLETLLLQHINSIHLSAEVMTNLIGDFRIIAMSQPDAETLNQLVQEITALIESSPSESLDDLIIILERYSTADAIKTTTRAKIRVIVLGNLKEKDPQIVHEDNFYFDDRACDDAQYEQDSFPDYFATTNVPDGLKVREKSTLYNVRGEKVYFGHLTDEDIAKLEGVYYVLSLNSAVRNTPTYAQIQTGESAAVSTIGDTRKELEEAGIETTTIQQAYMRTFADGIIISGKYTKNPKAPNFWSR